MKKNCSISRAEEISRIVEDNMTDLMDKLCENENSQVKDTAWSMLFTRMGFSTGNGDCFVLPPLDEC